MATLGEIKVPAAKVMNQVTVTVHVTGLGWRLFRLKCAIPLIWLATKIAGVGIDVDLGQRKGW